MNDKLRAYMGQMPEGFTMIWTESEIPNGWETIAVSSDAFVKQPMVTYGELMPLSLAIIRKVRP